MFPLDIPKKKKIGQFVPPDEVTTTSQMPSVEPQPRPLEPTLEAPTVPQVSYPSEFDNAEADLKQAVATPAEKQPLWKQALYMGLQAVRNIATGDTKSDYTLLGNDKKEYQVQQARKRFEPLDQRRRADQEYKYKNAQIDYAQQRPLIQQQNADTALLRAEVDAEYKANMAALGWEKAEQIAGYREQIIALKERGASQNDARIKILEKRIDATIADNKVRAEDRDLDRASRENIAKMKEKGATTRQNTKLNHAEAAAADAAKRGKDKAIADATKTLLKKKPDASDEDIANFLDKLKLVPKQK
jgi:hypothetical protein